VRVEDKVGPGKVKIALSFADWKDGHVAAATYDIDVAKGE
jgi:hypothetical protein